MLVNRKRLVKTLYAKVRENRITGNAMLDAGGGFPQVCHDAMDRLGVNQDFNSDSYESGYLDGWRLPLRNSVWAISEWA